MAFGGQDVSSGNSEVVEGGAAFSTVGFERDIVYFDDFLVGGFVVDAALADESDPSAKFCNLADKGAWLVTYDVAPTIVVADAEQGGVLVITTGSNANDFVSCQMNGEAWAVVDGKSIFFEARLKVSDDNDTRWIIGLCSTDVTGTTVGPILDSVGAAGSMIAFLQNADTATDINTLVQNGGTDTQVASGVDIVDDTFITFGIKVEADSSVYFYIDGTLVETTTTNIPTGDALTLSMEVHSPTASSTLEVDYIYCARPR